MEKSCSQYCQQFSKDFEINVSQNVLTVIVCVIEQKDHGKVLNRFVKMTINIARLIIMILVKVLKVVLI